MATPGMQQVSQMALHIEQMQAQLRTVLDLFAGLMIEKHGGQAFVKMDTMQAVAGQNMGILFNHDPILKQVQIQVGDKNNKPIIAMGDGIPAPEQPAAPNPEPESSVGVPSPACSALWHSDPNASGRRCPECGSAERVEPGSVPAGTTVPAPEQVQKGEPTASTDVFGSPDKEIPQTEKAIG